MNTNPTFHRSGTGPAGGRAGRVPSLPFLRSTPRASQRYLTRDVRQRKYISFHRRSSFQYPHSCTLNMNPIYLYFFLTLILIQTGVFSFVGFKTKHRLKDILFSLLKRYIFIIPMVILALLLYTSGHPVLFIPNVLLTLGVLCTPLLAILFAQSLTQIQRRE